MYMRLAFSVAINVDADILLIDEILSVGDEHFQKKCIEKLLELKNQGRTLVFVTVELMFTGLCVAALLAAVLFAQNSRKHPELRLDAPSR